MWKVTLIAEREKFVTDSLTFNFETALEVANFIEKCVQASDRKLEVKINYVDNEEGTENE